MLRADFGPERPAVSRVIRGVAAVAKQARPLPGSQLDPVMVNGAPGVVGTVRGRPVVVMRFTVVAGRVVEIDAIGDSERVRRIAAAVLADQ